MRSLIFFAGATVFAAMGSPAMAQPPTSLRPTLENVPYGPHERQKLDFYKAESTTQAPLFLFIHGGGWMNGDKANPACLQNCLAAGISVISINYRLIPDATAEGITPPVQACLQDSARALQFVRSRASEWNIDPHRICISGGSAGGFTALWLAFHPDMAEPGNADPVARESTRVRCALTFVPQTSLDPVQMRTWIPNNDYGHHAFSLASYQQFIDQRDQLAPWIKEFSPYELVSPDDPPVYLFYDTPPAPGAAAKDPPHSANFGAGLAEKLKSAGVEYEFNYPGAQVKHSDLFAFVTAQLKGPKLAAAASVKPPASSRVPGLFDLTNLAGIKTERASVSIEKEQGTKILQARFEAGAEYPGISFPMADGKKDLSDFTGIEATIKNTGHTDVMVALRVDNAGDWEKEPFNCEIDTLVPGSTKTISVTFGKTYGSPGYQLDPARISNILIFSPSTSETATLQISKLAPFRR